MNAIFTLNMVISVLFVVLYFYQYVYIVVGAFGRQKKISRGETESIRGFNRGAQ
ncbi:MAG: hypothetical protein LUI61_06190 [Firmicutes bacterium]|nr:hypothetical protein [Bacillota bacterium]